MNVSFGDQNATHSVPVTITTSSLTWTAVTSGVQTVTFSGGSSNNGPTLDKVVLTVAAVPGPSTVALLLAGAGVIGFVAHRRKTV